MQYNGIEDKENLKTLDFASFIEATALNDTLCTYEDIRTGFVLTFDDPDNKLASQCRARLA